MRIETKRFRTALLNAECEVYFGVGITASDRLDIVNLGPIPWKIHTGVSYRENPPTAPADLPPGRGWIKDPGDPEAAAEVLAAFHACGAEGGSILPEETDTTSAGDGVLFSHDTNSGHAAAGGVWPSYRVSAVLRKHHPYSELTARLTAVANA